MATDVTLPRLGQGMESGVIVRWLKEEGDTVAKGEPLYELDTDKVTQEVEAEVDGVLQKIVVTEGEVEVGATIAVIETNGRVRPRPRRRPPRRPASARRGRGACGRGNEARARGRAPPSEPERAAEDEAPPAAGAARGDGRLKASPLARRMARERGVDLAAVTGTGPEGRILAEDVERAPVGGAAPAAAPAERLRLAPAGEIEVVQLSSVRKTIARR